VSATLALVLAYAGFTALALAMDRHHRQIWRRRPTRRVRVLFRIGGWSGLAASLVLCLSPRWALGLVQWLGILSAAGLLVVAQLTLLSSAAGSPGRGLPRDAGETPPERA
jgi:hypothetical protein